MSEWKPFEIRPYDNLRTPTAPYDGKPFLACIWGNEAEGSWVAEAIYRRHYDDSDDRWAAKYEFFYVTRDPEVEGWKIRKEAHPFPITHWREMPLPPEVK